MVSYESAIAGFTPVDLGLASLVFASSPPDDSRALAVNAFVRCVFGSWGDSVG